MKKSFAELDSMKYQYDRQEKLEALQQTMSSLDGLYCPVCITDIDQYYQSCDQLQKLKKKMQV